MFGLRCLIMWIVVSVTTIGLALSECQEVLKRDRLSSAPDPMTLSQVVRSDSSVEFSLKAPAASSVEVHIEYMPPIVMTKNQAGTWTGISDPLSPDLYLYSLVVDRITVADPTNPLFLSSVAYGPTSILEVPKPGSLWEYASVPHGSIEHRYFHSHITGGLKDMFIYTPPGYEPTSRKPYPVLYLLHGLGDTADAWTTIGRVNVIMDNLLARRLTRPMLIVMPLAYGDKDPRTSVPEMLSEAPSAEGDSEMMRRFSASLIQEIMPIVRQNYRTSTNAHDNAIAGLSMGGSEALLIGLEHPGVFDYIGSFSGALDMWGTQSFDQVFKGVEFGLRRRDHILWLSCGKQDALRSINENFEHWLTSRGIHYYALEQGGAHSWRFWRDNLISFAQKLFR